MSATVAARMSAGSARRAPVVAMAGAGQLARMTHQAAVSLGVELRVLAGDDGDPAVRAGARRVRAGGDEPARLRALAAGADVLTFDHERFSPAALAALERDGIRLAPSAAAKRLAQDKLHARRVLAAAGFPVPPFAAARTPADVAAFAERHGWPLVAKAPAGGYDGRGVMAVPGRAAAAAALAAVAGPLLIEPRVAIERELAVLVARTEAGEEAVYPVVETVQRDAMCREVLAPAPVEPAVAREAQRLARCVAAGIGATGILAVELFLTPGGLLVNELALRPHNAGHFTIEGAVTSQFEQHLRAVLDWPLGATRLTAPAVAMVNVVGPDDGSDPAARLPAALAVGGAHVHLYGKPARPGRKLGHVTACGADLECARATARAAAAALTGAAA